MDCRINESSAVGSNNSRISTHVVWAKVGCCRGQSDWLLVSFEESTFNVHDLLPVDRRIHPPVGAC